MTNNKMRAGGPVRRVKRIRINFSKRQIEAMETVFAQTQYPDVNIVEILGQRLELPIEKICTWFQNRRSKFRKEYKKNQASVPWVPATPMYAAKTPYVSAPAVPRDAMTSHDAMTSRANDKQPPQAPVAPNQFKENEELQPQMYSPPAAAFCMSAYVSTPSPQQLNPAMHSYRSDTMYTPPNQYNQAYCMSSWSNQQSLSSPQQQSAHYDTNESPLSQSPCAHTYSPSGSSYKSAYSGSSPQTTDAHFAPYQVDYQLHENIADAFPALQQLAEQPLENKSSFQAYLQWSNGQQYNYPSDPYRNEQLSPTL